MAGFERLKARSTAGFKRKVRVKPTSEARLNAYLSDVERTLIKKRGVRKLRFIGTPKGKPAAAETPKVKEFKGKPAKTVNIPAGFFRTHSLWGAKI